MALPISLYWFRQDLRLADNPALTAAAQAGTVIPANPVKLRMPASHFSGVRRRELTFVVERENNPDRQLRPPSIS